MDKFEDKVRITGIGMSDTGRRLMRDPVSLALDACLAAMADAGLTRADVDRAIPDFNKWGAAAVREGLRFAYHIHGYEFLPSPEGTLLDTLFARTDPQYVDYELDVFWVTRGGGDPVSLLGRYGARCPILHLKDMRRGTKTGVLTGEAPVDTNVVLGTGIVAWPAVLKAAMKAGVKWYFIEDEHPDAVKQIPQSLDYLRSLKL